MYLVEIYTLSLGKACNFCLHTSYNKKLTYNESLVLFWISRQSI